MLTSAEKVESVMQMLNNGIFCKCPWVDDLPAIGEVYEGPKIKHLPKCAGLKKARELLDFPEVEQ